MILFVGAVTCIVGVLLVLRHLHLWRKQIDATDDGRQRLWLNRQLRRRTLTSTCIALLGFVVATLHFQEYWQTRPTGWMIMVTCTLVLGVMIFVLASLDLLATGTMLRTDRDGATKAARELAREYHRMKGKTTDRTDPPPADTGKEGTTDP